MEITQVRVFPVEEEKLKAFVSVVFDDCFVVSDIKIIQGVHGLFVSMPSKKRRDGTFRDIAHPLNSETRRRFEDAIIERYRALASEADHGPIVRMREVDGVDEATAGVAADRGEDRTWT